MVKAEITITCHGENDFHLWSDGSSTHGSWGDIVTELVEIMELLEMEAREINAIRNEVKKIKEDL